MCVSPITRPNPWYLSKSKYAYLHDTTSATIGVPCGYCDECISRMQLGIVERAIMESIYNHIFMCTLTYNEESIPRLTTSSGFEFRYADYKDLKMFFDRLRTDKIFPRGFRTLAVTERGAENGRPHFHILFFVPKNEKDDYNWCISEEQRLHPLILSQWYTNVGSTRKPIKKPLCTYVRRVYHGKIHTNYDLHYVNPNFTSDSVASVAFYVTKYLLKRPDKDKRLQIALKLNLPFDEYTKVWSLVRNSCHLSKYFGLNSKLVDYGPDKIWQHDSRIIDYLAWGVRQSIGRFPYPCFINPLNGLWFPLTQYYKMFPEILPANIASSFLLDSLQENRDTLSFYDELKSVSRKKFLESISSTDIFSEYL